MPSVFLDAVNWHPVILVAGDSFMNGLTCAGTSISNGLITVRQMADPNFVSQNESPNIVLNSLAWTLHMGVSSNVRYQMLNGLDMVCTRKSQQSVMSTQLPNGCQRRGSPHVAAHHTDVTAAPLVHLVSMHTRCIRLHDSY